MFFIDLSFYYVGKAWLNVLIVVPKKPSHAIPHVPFCMLIDNRCLGFFFTRLFSDVYPIFHTTSSTSLGILAKRSKIAFSKSSHPFRGLVVLISKFCSHDIFYGSGIFWHAKPSRGTSLHNRKYYSSSSSRAHTKIFRAV